MLPKAIWFQWPILSSQCGNRSCQRGRWDGFGMHWKYVCIMLYKMPMIIVDNQKQTVTLSIMNYTKQELGSIMFITFEQILLLWPILIYMYFQTISLTMLTNISLHMWQHQNDLMTMMPDATWSHLAIANELIVVRWLHMPSDIFVNFVLGRGAISVLRNERKWKFIFKFPKI